MSASENAGPRRGVDCEIPYWLGEENETFFIRGWKPLPSRRVLKTLRESSKGKAQRGQYLLEVGLDGYKWYKSQALDNVLARRLSPEGGWTQDFMPARTLGPEGR